MDDWRKWALAITGLAIAVLLSVVDGGPAAPSSPRDAPAPAPPQGTAEPTTGDRSRPLETVASAEAIREEAVSVESGPVEPEETPAAANVSDERGHSDEAPPLDAEASSIVGGRILVDGRVPGRELALALVEKTYLVAGSLPFIPNEAPRTTATPDGSFSFRVPDDWSGALQLPPGHGRRSRPGGPVENFVRVEEPTPDLLVDVHAFESIHGRVLEAETGSPVAGAKVSVMLTGQHLLRTHQGETDAGGRFAIGTPVEGPLEDILWMAEGPGETFGKRELAPHEFRRRPDGSVELGELYVSGSYAVAVTVVDPRGPVPGARFWGFDPLVAGGATDEAGRAEILVVGEGRGVMQILTGDHWPELHPVPQRGSPELQVRLEPLNSLELIVEAEDGGPPPVPSLVSLSTEGPIRGRWDAQQESWRGASGSPLHGVPEIETDETEGPPSIIRKTLDEDGRAKVVGLWPGKDLIVSIRGPSLSEPIVDEISGLGESENRVRRFVAPFVGGSIEGWVVDAAGNPLAGATVSALGGIREASRTHSDEAGAFLLRGLGADSASLHIKREGYATLETEEIRVGGPAETWELEAGRVVTVTVADASGYPVGGLSVTCASARAKRDAFGTYLLRDLPSGVVDVEIRLDGLTLTYPHDTARPKLRAEVPALGRLQVEWAAPVGDDASPRVTDLRLHPSQAGGDALRLFVFGSDDGTTKFEHVPVGTYVAEITGYVWQGSGNDRTLTKKRLAGPARVTISADSPALLQF